MASSSKGPRIYLSHPKPAHGSATAAGARRTLSRLFPGARVLDASASFRSSEAWLANYRAEIAKSCALVFFPWHGTISYRVHCEVVAAGDRGVPTLLLSGGRLFDTWSLSVLDHRHQWARFARVRARGGPVDPAAALRRRPQPARVFPSGALGRVIENRMIEYLIVLSDGRLVVYRPESDFEGTDLHVSLRHERAVLKVQVKGNTGHREGRYQRVQVPAASIPEGDPKHILFVDYDLKAAEPRRFVWLVPSEAYRAKANKIGAYYKASLAIKPTAADKWVDYRYNTRDIAWVVEELLKRGRGSMARSGGA